MYFHTSAHPVCTDMIPHQRVPVRMKGTINVISTVMFSHRWMRHEVIWQHCIQSSTNVVSHLVASLLFAWTHSCVLEEAWLWWVICREGGDLACKVSLLSLAFPKWNKTSDRSFVPNCDLNTSETIDQKRTGELVLSIRCWSDFEMWALY